MTAIYYIKKQCYIHMWLQSIDPPPPPPNNIFKNSKTYQHVEKIVKFFLMQAKQNIACLFGTE
jgi:hypothetical protein